MSLLAAVLAGEYHAIVDWLRSQLTWIADSIVAFAPDAAADLVRVIEGL